MVARLINLSFTKSRLPNYHSPADAEGMRITPPFSHPSPRPAREQPQYPPTGITAPAKMAGAVLVLRIWKVIFRI